MQRLRRSFCKHRIPCSSSRTPFATPFTPNPSKPSVPFRTRFVIGITAIFPMLVAVAACRVTDSKGDIAVRDATAGQHQRLPLALSGDLSGDELEDDSLSVEAEANEVAGAMFGLVMRLVRYLAKHVQGCGGVLWRKCRFGLAGMQSMIALWQHISRSSILQSVLQPAYGHPYHIQQLVKSPLPPTCASTSPQHQQHLPTRWVSSVGPSQLRFSAARARTSPTTLLPPASTFVSRASSH